MNEFATALAHLLTDYAPTVLKLVAVWYIFVAAVFVTIIIRFWRNP